MSHHHCRGAIKERLPWGAAAAKADLAKAKVQKEEEELRRKHFAEAAAEVKRQRLAEAAEARQKRVKRRDRTGLTSRTQTVERKATSTA